MRQDYFFVGTATGEYETERLPLFINCAGYAELDRPGNTVLPSGRRDYTYYYLTEGEMEFSFCGGPYAAVPPGTVIVIPPKTPFAYRHLQKETVVIWWAHFTGNYVSALLAENGIAGGVSVLPVPVCAAAMRDFQNMLDEMRAVPDACARQRAAAAFVLLVTRVTELRQKAEQKRRLDVSLDYIRTHYAEPVSKEALAAMEHISLSQYNLLFRRLTGYSPAGYVTRLRMERARQLLSERDVPVAEVARLCGYDDPYYFSRCFRRENGVTPRDYRAGNQSGDVSKNNPATAKRQAIS